MSTPVLHELNQHYVRLTDRCRSQWTFYQFLQGLFKHLLDAECPLDLDFPALFNDLRGIANILPHPETGRTEKAIAEFAARLDQQALKLFKVDVGVPTSLLRRFFDRLRNQDEKVLLAVIKFYLEAKDYDEDTLDKLHLLLTRLAEIPRENSGSLTRERHEIERMVQPLLQGRPPLRATADEVDVLLRAIADLRSEVLAARRFTELVSGGALDRFRTLRLRIGENMLHPRLLPALLETTMVIKNRFRELWREEETHLMEDTNRVREVQRHLAAHPEMMTAELRDALETFDNAHSRFTVGKQEENIRREDILGLRLSLNRILEQFDADNLRPSSSAPQEGDVVTPPGPREETGIHEARPQPESAVIDLPADPLLQETISKMVFALELVGRDTNPAQAAGAKELQALRLEVCEVEAIQAVLAGRVQSGTLTGERARQLIQAAALRLRMDEEAREIDRLDRMGSERLAVLLERATQSLQRAYELDKRFDWFIDDALYRGDTDFLERLHRARFRLLRAYSGLWLIHNDRGGVSPF